MTNPIHMVQIAMDARRLARWTAECRLGDTDLGYACHAAMCDAYGDMRLKPFTVSENDGKVIILGYGTHNADEMRRIRVETSRPSVDGLFLSEESKGMPAAWEGGRRYSFTLRVAPTRQGKTEAGKRREGDALLFEPGGADREQTYAKWLTERFGDAAAIETCSMQTFRLLTASRRFLNKETGKRPVKPVTLPDATFRGVLRVKDPAAFKALFESGVGRHKAFGFGALMLMPPRAA